MNSILQEIVGFMLMGILGMLSLMLAVLILSLLFVAVDQSILDGKLTPIAKNKIQKLLNIV